MEERQDAERITEGFEASPFSYHQGMRMDLENKKRFCSKRELYGLMEKGFITEHDIELMKVLYEHGYLSQRAASDIIHYDLGILPEHKRRQYKNSFRKLVKMGAVHRYLPAWEEEGKIRKGVCIYCLSTGASFYIGRLYRKDTSYFTYASQMLGNFPETMLGSAAAGQFHSNVLKFHSRELRKAYINFSFSFRREKCLIPLRYIFSGEHAELHLAVLPVRSNEKFKVQAVHFLSSVYMMAKREGNDFHALVYVFICENSRHARRLAEELKAAGYGNVPILYCLDRSLIQEDIFGNMFTVEEGEEGYRIQMQTISV